MLPMTSSFEPYFYLIVRYESLETKLKEEFDNLLQEIQNALISGKDIEAQIQSSYNHIFRLRVLALKSILEENESIQELMEESYPYFEEIAQDEKLSVLGENILFAIRSNIRVANSLLNQVELSNQSIKGILDQIQGSIIDFDQFTALLIMSVPPEFSKTLLDWVKTSLALEYCIIVGALLKEKKIELDNASVDNVASIIAEATQTYNAIAIEFGILKLSSHPISESAIMDPSFIQDQERLANSDIKSFAKIWN